ncbi:MAG TPA: hypothetical protein VK681_15605 [Reyranella sp.]|jgi:hypothetical protein|nr:hypothetical protein [Reyranella sp.]
MNRQLFLLLVAGALTIGAAAAQTPYAGMQLGRSRRFPTGKLPT